MANVEEWINDDGLRVKFGTLEAKNSPIGEFSWDEGSLHLLEVELNPETLSETGLLALYECRLGGGPAQPDGEKTIVLKKAEVFVEKAFVGTGFTLTAGIQKVDGTAISATGILTSKAVGAFTAGATITGDGALLGTRVTSDMPTELTLTVGAPLTAGKGWLKVWYYVDRL